MPDRPQPPATLAQILAAFPRRRGWTPWHRMHGEPGRRVRFYVSTTATGPAAIREQHSRDPRRRR